MCTRHCQSDGSLRIRANIEWVGTLCTALTIACTIQLITTGILTITVPDVLSLTNSYIPTVTGLIASLITLPTALRLKTSQMSPNMDRIYGYTMCYQRLAVCVSGGVHFCALLLSIIALAVSTNLGTEFYKLVKDYHTKQSTKSLVDNVQYILQCCGAYSYEDWFKFNWRNSPLVDNTHNKHAFHELLSEDTDAYPDLALVRFDAVPFSCCARKANTPCIHQNLLQLGLGTINLCGCGVRLRVTVQAILWAEFAIYSLCFSLEIAVLVLLRDSLLEENQKNRSSYRSYQDETPRTWGIFSNYDSSTAILSPSSHSEKTLKKCFK